MEPIPASVEWDAALERPRHNYSYESEKTSWSEPARTTIRDTAHRNLHITEEIYEPARWIDHLTLNERTLSTLSLVPAVNELTSDVHIYNIHRYTVDMKNTRTYSRTSSELVGEQTDYTGSLTWNYQLGFCHYHYLRREVFGWKLNGFESLHVLTLFFLFFVDERVKDLCKTTFIF